MSSSIIEYEAISLKAKRFFKVVIQCTSTELRRKPVSNEGTPKAPFQTGIEAVPTTPRRDHETLDVQNKDVYFPNSSNMYKLSGYFYFG